MVDRIVWLDADELEKASSDTATSLTLSLSSVTESMDSTKFKCRTVSDFGGQEVVVVIKVEGGGGIEFIVSIVGGSIGGLIVVLVCMAVIITLCFCFYKKRR